MAQTRKFTVSLERYLPQHVDVTVYATDIGDAEDAALLLYKETDEGILKWTSETDGLKEDEFFPWAIDVVPTEENGRAAASRTGGLLKDTR